MKHINFKVHKSSITQSYLFQNFIRFNSVTTRFINKISLNIAVRQLEFSKNGCIYEVKTANRTHSYNDDFEILNAFFYKKIHPVLIMKTSETGEVVEILNQNNIAFNWSKHKKQIIKLTESLPFSKKMIDELDNLMFSDEEFLEAFKGKVEIKLLFPAIYETKYDIDKKYVKSESCDELALKVNIPLQIECNWGRAENINSDNVLRFRGKLNEEKFGEIKEDETESEEGKLRTMVRTLKDDVTAKYRPEIKQTGFYCLNETHSVRKSLEVIKVKIPEFIYQDRLTSLTIQN